MPSLYIRPLQTLSTAGLPCLLPTVSAVSTSLDRWSYSRRYLLFQLYIHRDAVSLICPDQCLIPVKAVPLLGIGCHNLLQLIHIYLPSGAVNAGNQLFRISPSVFIQPYARRLGLMAQNQADENA